MGYKIKLSPTEIVSEIKIIDADCELLQYEDPPFTVKLTNRCVCALPPSIHNSECSEVKTKTV